MNNKNLKKIKKVRRTEIAIINQIWFMFIRTLWKKLTKIFKNRIPSLIMIGELSFIKI